MPAAQVYDRRRPAAHLRDLLTGSALFAATAAFTLWQNSRVAVLWDLSYLLETSWRISLGQLPYRDFPLAHAPGTFLLHAAILRIFGRVYRPHIACAAIESGAAALLTWRILVRILHQVNVVILSPERGGAESNGRRIPAFGSPAHDSRNTYWPAALLAATLIPLGIYSIYPHPIYDGDCILALLTALYLLLRAADSWDVATTSARRVIARNLIAGSACVVPVIFKQNVGLAFLAAVLAAVLGITAVRRIRKQAVAPQVWLLCGVFAALIAAALAIHLAFGLANYRTWTITFAAQRRLPALSTMLGVYHQASLLWTIPAALAGVLFLRSARLSAQLWTRVLAFLLLASPFLWTLTALLFTADADDRADQLLSLWPHLLILAAILAVVRIERFAREQTSAANSLLPILLLTAIHGTFLSQQLWGSTYAIWPLLLLLIAMLLVEVRALAVPLAVVVAATLLICGGLYAAGLERLDYIRLGGPEARAELPSLRGISTPGPWIPEFQQLVRFTGAEIPAGDNVLIVPGETPFYFTTGRTPDFPILLFDRTTTDPFTPQQVAELARVRNIRWLIVQRNLQIDLPPAFGVAETEAALLPDFSLDRRLPGYDIYRRR